MDNFIFRPVREEDRAEILELTAHTWEHGDYIGHVFDDWVADAKGIFLAIVDAENNKIAGIDKLTMLAPGEAWFEGLRIGEEYRGRGLASQVQRHMIEEAGRLGAKSIRLVTRNSNMPIHIAAYRDGFAQVGQVRPFNWQAQTESAARTETEAYILRRATPEEAPILYEGWLRKSAYRVAGLINYSWSFKGTNVEEWIDAARDGYLLVKADAQLDPNRLPDPCTLLKYGGESSADAWTICTISAASEQWGSMLGGLLIEAQERGIGEIEGMLPDEHAAIMSASKSGLDSYFGESAFSVYQLALV